MNPWEELEHELEAAVHPVFADRLLDDVLDSDNMLGAYGAVADLAAVLHHGPTEAELAREAETIAAMAKIRRSANTPVRSYGRRSLAAVAAAAAMSTSVAWASGLPVVVQEATAHALAEIGSVAARVRGDESTDAPVAHAAPSSVSFAHALDARPDTRLPELPVSATPRGVPDELEPPAPTVAPVVEPSAPETVLVSAPTPAAPPPAPAAEPTQPSPPAEPELPPVTSEREIELPVEDALAVDAPVDETETGEDTEGGSGKPADPGKPDDKGKPDDPGNKPDDPGKPEDPGNKPDDPGKPDDKGKPDDPGKPEDPVEPEPPADEPDPGPPEDKGKPEDPGPPDHAVANGLDKDKKND